MSEENEDHARRWSRLMDLPQSSARVRMVPGPRRSPRSRLFLWRNERGFTLQELLTTITIMGILIAIGVILFLALLERWRVNAATNQLAADLRLAHSSATNQLTDWRVVLYPERAEDEQGPDYFLVKLATPYDPDISGNPPPAVDTNTPPEARYFQGNVKIMNIRGGLDAGGWIVAPSRAEETRTVEFNSDGTAKVYQAASGSTCVTVDKNPENRPIVTAATSRVRVEYGECD